MPDSISSEGTEGEWKCDICNTSFTSKYYHTAHLGTKKHKRKVRSDRKGVYEKGYTGESIQSPSIEEDTTPPFEEGGQGTSTPPELELPNSTGPCDYQGVREPYRQKNVKSFEDYYILYTSSAVAYWAIKLALNPTVQDFKISVNNKNWEDFGDAVVEIQFRDFLEKPSVSITCAIQLKQIASNNIKSLDSFIKGEFSYDGIVKQIKKIKGKTGIEYTKFIVYTTSAPSPTLDTALTVSCCAVCLEPTATCKCPKDKGDPKDEVVYGKTFSNRKNVILNTSEDNETIYRFYPKAQIYNLPNINVYSCQKKLREFPAAIEEIVFDAFGQTGVPVANIFIKYIENWGKGRCGGFFKLKKEEVLVKLGQLFLAPLIVTPKTKGFEGPASRFALWVQAIYSTDVTILKPIADLSKLIEPFDLLIEKELALKINTTNDTILVVRTKEKDDIRNIENSVLRAFLSEETLKDFENSLPLEKVYLIFWKAGLMPLTLQVKDGMDQDYVFKVITTLKIFGLTRRYLVQTINGNIQPFDAKIFKPLTFFTNLGDISDKLGLNLLDKIQLGVTDNFSISLATIEKSDAFFKRTICANELFHMILGNYAFKSFNYEVRLREDENTKLILNSQLMEKFRLAVESRSPANLRESRRKDLIHKHWLHGVDPDLFL